MINKLTIKLKQHTPLIHFQHRQHGATLRASEVKPKLDKFLYEIRDGAIPNEWRVNKQHQALDYKLRVSYDNNAREEYLIGARGFKTIQNKPDKVKLLPKTAFFAQEGINISKKSEEAVIFEDGPAGDRTYTFIGDNWNKVEKKGLKWKNVEVSIICCNQELYKHIYYNIAKFFNITSFGTRSNKGFGSFSACHLSGSLNDKSEVYTEDNFKEHLKEYYKFYYYKSSQNFGSALKDISSDYRILKSGQNEPYRKSKLFLWLLHQNKNQRWDKRYIKRFINNEWTNENITHNPMFKTGLAITTWKKKEIIAPIGAGEDGMKDDWKDCFEYDRTKSKYDYQAIRLAFGLAERYEFNSNIGNNIKIIAELTVTKEGGNIVQRYQSPIIFKVFGSTIYVVVNEKTINALKGCRVVYNIKARNISEKSTIGVSKNSNEKPIFVPNIENIEDLLDFALLREAQDEFDENLNYNKIDAADEKVHSN